MARKHDHKALRFWETNWRKHTMKACKSAGLGYSETQRILEHMRVHGEVPNADAQRLVHYADWDLLGLVPTFMRVTRPNTL